MEKGITPVLAQMEVGDVESWPIERLDSVRVSAGRFKLKNRRRAYLWRLLARRSIIQGGNEGRQGVLQRV